MCVALTVVRRVHAAASGAPPGREGAGHLAAAARPEVDPRHGNTRSDLDCRRDRRDFSCAEGHDVLVRAAHLPERLLVAAGAHAAGLRRGRAARGVGVFRVPAAGVAGWRATPAAPREGVRSAPAVGVRRGAGRARLRAQRGVASRGASGCRGGGREGGERRHATSREARHVSAATRRDAPDRATVRSVAPRYVVEPEHDFTTQHVPLQPSRTHAGSGSACSLGRGHDVRRPASNKIEQTTINCFARPYTQVS